MPNGLPQQDAEIYLGDGLYARFDGFQVILRAPRELGDHYVGLEPDTYRSLQAWIERHPRLKAHLVRPR